MPLPWAAMGIGALIGGMTSKQRGGNFLKGALQGAALGGITGGLGAKYGGAAGGPFGFGTKMLPNFLAYSGITMGSEMLGQSDANKLRMQQQRKWLDEEEERRIARLNEMAGYDVSKARLTPETYFMASGGITNMPQYANGGWHNVPGEEPGPTMDPEIMQLPMGQEGSFESENEDFLELAGLTDEEMSELQALQSLSIVTPEGDPNYERIQLRLQELMGRMKVAKGGQINRPGYEWGGLMHGSQQQNPHMDPAPFTYGGRSPMDESQGYAGQEIEQMKRDSFVDNFLKKQYGPETFEWDYEQDEETGDWIPAYERGFEAAQGGQVNRPGYFLGGALGIGALLGGAGLLSKVLGRRKKGERGPIKDKPWNIKPIPRPGTILPDDEDDIPQLLGLGQILNRAQGGQVNRPGYAWGGSSIANQGFDTSGGETWQQAKATQMNDPGLWTNKFFDQRTDMAKDYNQLLKDRNRLGEGYIDRSGVINTEEKFFNEYPNIPQTFKPFEDLDEQMRIGEFPKKAPEGYFEQYNLAQGGIADLDMRGGGHSIGPGTGTSDDVPAMLSDGEFVMTADAVSNLGGGDRMLGARRMYNMMNQLDPNSQSPGEMNVAGYG
jgi:hypothetical protein